MTEKYLIKSLFGIAYPLKINYDYTNISFSLPACKFGRACYCHSFREDGANYGRCPSKKETYFGSRSMP